MDTIRNPFAPGAGNPPPELAGRGDLLQQAEIVLSRSQQGRHAKSFMLVGLRGTGKTVLLNRMLQEAEKLGLKAEMIEAPEDKSLPELLIPVLRKILLQLDRMAAASAVVSRSLRVLRSFAKTIKVKHGGIEYGLDIEPEQGIADSGDLDSDLPDLLVAVAQAAKDRGTAVALLIDELQYIGEKELSALIMGIHKVSQRELPLVLIAAGLPQLVANMGRSKSYAERLFDFPNVGPLSKKDASVAIHEPIAKEGERIAGSAIDEIVNFTQGYPFFLQVWGYYTWNKAEQSPITLKDVHAAAGDVLRNLDSSFFRVRFDRLTPSEKRYLRAMAELGAGPHRSGDIANILDVKVSSVAPIRNNLIGKGMIYAPAHGDTAFTVPLFDSFMKRVMPTLE